MSATLREIYEIYPTEATTLRPLGLYVDGLVLAQGLTAPEQVTSQLPEQVEQQMEGCLTRLRHLVEGANASLDCVARVVCYVRSAADRDPVYQAWEKLFPDPQDRPAFKVLTGDLPARQSVRLDVIALPGSRRKRLDLQNVEARDPTTVIGDWFFTSRLHGISPDTGTTPAGLQAQAEQALTNVGALLKQAGFAPSDVQQLTAFGRDASYIDGARTVVERFVARSGSMPPLNTLTTWVRPQSEVMFEAIAHRQPPEERDAPVFRELYLDPERDNRACGFRYGSLLFAADVSPLGNSGPVEQTSDTELQLRAALQNMDALLRLGGATRKEVARVTFFMRDLAERPVLNQVWSEWYPDPIDRPPHTYLPASLPPGQNVALQLLALVGASRTVLEVEGVQHGDPMSLGAVTGNLLTSSRIFGAGGRETPEGLDAHTLRCFANATGLLTNAGADWRSVRQLVVYGDSPAYRDMVSRRLDEVSNGGEVPRLQFLETNLGRGTLLPRLQLLALI